MGQRRFRSPLLAHKPQLQLYIAAKHRRKFAEPVKSCASCQSHRFDLRFFRPFPADLSIKKSSSFFPPLIAATSQRGLAPRPAQVSPDGLRYFGGTFIPFKTLPPPLTTLVPPTTAILSNCSISLARCSTSISSTRTRRSMRASTFIPDRFTFGIVIS